MKIKALIFAIIINIFIFAAIAGAEEYIGDLYTDDTTAFIDGLQIPVYNYNNYPYAVAEDLGGYGFDIKWVQAEKTLYLNYDRYKNYYPYKYVDFSIDKAYQGSVYKSDTKVMLNGEQIPAYSLNGRMIISLDELWRIGRVNWYDESKTVGVTTNNFMNKNSDWRTLLKPYYLIYKIEHYYITVEDEYEAFADYVNYEHGYYNKIYVSEEIYRHLNLAKANLQSCLWYVENDQNLYERGNIYHMIYNAILTIDDTKIIYETVNGYSLSDFYRVVGEELLNSSDDYFYYANLAYDNINPYIDRNFIPAKSVWTAL